MGKIIKAEGGGGGCEHWQDLFIVKYDHLLYKYIFLQLERFAEPVADGVVVDRSRAGVPKNTQHHNKWAVNTWTKWSIARSNRRVVDTEENVVCDKFTKMLISLDHMPDDQLNYWIGKFILETRKADGSQYPPKTVFALVMGIQSHLRLNCGREVNFLSSFLHIRQVLDSKMKGLSNEGMQLASKKADTLNISDENNLWSSKALGDYNAKVLVRTVHYLNGTNFALRGGQEHRRLRYRPAQITKHENTDVYVIAQRR